MQDIPKGTKIESITTNDNGANEFKFEGIDAIYEQVASIPNSDGSTTIGLIVKGTTIDVDTDNRFYITLYSNKV